MNDAALPWICKRDVEFAQLNENRIFLAYCPSKSGFVAISRARLCPAVPIGAELTPKREKMVYYSALMSRHLM